MKILYRYILKEHIGPFLFSLLTILFVLVMQFLTRFFERFVGKGIEPLVIAELIVLQVAWIVSLAVPMAVLIAVLVAFGGITNRSEMNVMRAGGLPLTRLIVPVFVVGGILSVLMERFNNVVLPEANFMAKQLIRDISKAKPSFGLTENAFSGLVDGYSILVREVGDDGDDLKGVTIYETLEGGKRTVITAENGNIRFSPDSHYLILSLFDGQVHEAGADTDQEYRIMKFEKHRFVFASTGYGFERSDGSEIRRGDRELSAGQLYSMGQDFRKREDEALRQIGKLVQKEKASVNNSLASVDNGRGGALKRQGDAKARAREKVDTMIKLLDRSINHAEKSRNLHNKYMVEYHKKYALSCACVIFVLVGAPLGVLAKRGGFGVGAGLSLLFFVLYWFLLVLGEKLSDRSLLDPGFAMWLANIVMLIIGLAALYRVSGRIIGSGR